MKKLTLKKISAIGLFTSAMCLHIACQHTKSTATTANATTAVSSPATPPTKPAHWVALMHDLDNSLSILLPLTQQPQTFADSKNQKVIHEQVVVLADLAKTLKTQKPPDQDPAITLISEQFEEDIRQAVSAIDNGHPEYARHLLKNSTSYCIQCHTRNSLGPHFAGGKLTETASGMSPLDRGEYLAATRQFDLALKEYQGVLKNSKNIVEWDRAAHNALAVSVRYLGNPDQSLQTVDIILNSKTVPLYLHENAKQWRQSILSWQKESKTKTTHLSSQALKNLKSASQLIQRAQKMQKYPSDHSADIEYLRASALLHDALGNGLTGKDKSEALYLAGICYDSIRDLSMWNLNEKYFELCIRNTPHTELAKKCFRKYEESVFVGFMGGQNLLLPPEVQKKLLELKTMAGQ